MTVSLPSNSKPMDEFIDKLKTKIRDDIASMLPEDVIQTMALGVLKDEFLTKKRVNKGSTYRDDWVTEPSEFQKMVIEASKPILQEIIKTYVEENKQQLVEQTKEIINNGIMKLITKFLQDSIAQVLQDNSSTIAYAVKEEIKRSY